MGIGGTELLRPYWPFDGQSDRSRWRRIGNMSMPLSWTEADRPRRSDVLALHSALLTSVEARRLELTTAASRSRRATFGQFFTPMATARLMASMVSDHNGTVRVLDAGAGFGALTAALTAELCCRIEPPEALEVTCFDIDDAVCDSLAATLKSCSDLCAAAGVDFRYEIRNQDFVEAAVRSLDGGLFGPGPMEFEVAILNPPYKKIGATSRPRRLLEQAGFSGGNLYAAFVSLAVALVREGGDIVAITPRSFCNGPYFRSFREELLSRVSLARLHSFASRMDTFRDDEVLQENLIVHGRRSSRQQQHVFISTSPMSDQPVSSFVANFERIVRPGDPERFIHLVGDDDEIAAADVFRSLPCSLADLGLSVSTGRVVDFRVRHWLGAESQAGFVPLIYPANLVSGRVAWPKAGGRKPEAISEEAGERLLVPAGFYVLTKRFSAKEEPRRLVAAVFEPDVIPCSSVGFENHLNYFHAGGRPLPHSLARGLSAYLNSSQLDQFFRQFNGHTQVNATDLRSLRYPSRSSLERLGQTLGSTPTQRAIDGGVEALLTSGEPNYS
jgi:adenine-specific DNA-methyltransferase